MRDRLGDRVGYFPKNQEELEEMANARVPDEFIFCRDANTYRVESRESHRPSVRQPQLPPRCLEGLTRTQKRRLQHERREDLSKGRILANLEISSNRILEGKGHRQMLTWYLYCRWSFLHRPVMMRS